MKRSGKRGEMLIAEIDETFAKRAPDRMFSRVLAQGLFEGRPPMTRGRSLDVVTREHLKLVSSQWPRHTVDRPIFIVGVGRSGTTLLGRILAAGKGVGYLKEPKALWSTAVEREDISGFYDTDGRFALGAQDATPEIADSVGAMYNWYGFLTRSRRIVDKYPEMTYRVPFLRALFPDAKIIAIVREPGAVIRSIVEYSTVMADDRGNWWGVDDAKWHHMVDQLIDGDETSAVDPSVTRATTDPATRARAEWILGAEHLLAAKSQLDGIIRFEELLADPDGVLRGLCETLELNPNRIVSYGCEVVGEPKMTSSQDPDAVLAPLMAQLGYETATP